MRKAAALFVAFVLGAASWGGLSAYRDRLPKRLADGRIDLGCGWTTEPVATDQQRQHQIDDLLLRVAVLEATLKKGK